MRVLLIALAGTAGTLARYGLEGLVRGRAGTLTVNVSGSLLLGFILRYALGSTVISPDLRGALTIGFCAAFTTMSTFSYETMALVADGDYWRAAMYLAGTILGCLLAVALGMTLADKLL